jgi:hypothetical protein
MEAEEYPLQEAISKQQIHEHIAEWEDLENGAVICRTHRIVKVLLTTCSYEYQAPNKFDNESKPCV